MAAPDMSAATWRKSSRSNGQGQCVEFTIIDDGSVAVRDSKDPSGPVLVIDTAGWRTFLTGTTRDRFRH